MKLIHDISVYEKNSEYDLDNCIMLDYYSNRIIEKTVNSEDKSLLELGLGHGYTSKVFHNRYGQYTILEGDGNIINKFKKENPQFNAEIIETFFEEYDTNQLYDVVVLGFILEHVDDALGIVKKYSKYISENGSMYIAVPNAKSLNRRIGYKAGLLEDIYKLSDNDLRLGHKRYFDLNIINQMCEDAGLHIVSTEGIYLKPITSAQMKKLNFDSNIYKSLCEVGREYPELCCGILVECKK